MPKSTSSPDGEVLEGGNIVILQTVHPSHTKKILYYHKDPITRNRMFPEQFGTIVRRPTHCHNHPSSLSRLYWQPPSSLPLSFSKQAEEIGPLPNTSTSPCLTIIKGIQTSAEQLITWLHTEPPLRFGICRLYWLGKDHHIAASLQDLTNQIIDHYTAHIAPSTTTSSSNKPIFRLQCSPRNLEVALGDTLLPHSFNFCPIGYDYLINALILDDGCIHWQILPPDCFWQNPHSAHRRQVTCTNGGVCKATGKLWEALIATGLDDRIKRCNVLDIGAAPGGWTMYLTERGAKKVIAVDPAALDPAVFLLDNNSDTADQPSSSSTMIHHIRDKAQNAIPEILDLLNGDSLDVVVSDMNVHPCHMTQIISPLLNILTPGGILIVTLKFGGRGGGGEREESLKMWEEYLGEGYEGVKLLWLLGNTVTERTIVAQKKKMNGAL